MSSRNDGYLHSGLQPPVRKQQLKAKEEETKLEPKAEAVLTEIAKIKAELVSVEHLLLDDSLIPETRLRKVQRLKDQYDIVNRLETRMKKLLGVK